MKLFAFTKKGIVYIIAISVLLASYFSTVIMNYASDKITGEHLFATLLFQLIFALFEFLTVYKKAAANATVSLKQNETVAHLKVCKRNFR